MALNFSAEGFAVEICKVALPQLDPRFTFGRNWMHLYREDGGMELRSGILLFHFSGVDDQPMVTYTAEVDDEGRTWRACLVEIFVNDQELGSYRGEIVNDKLQVNLVTSEEVQPTT